MTRVLTFARSETTAPPALAGADGGTVHGGSDSRPPLTNLITPRAPDKPWLAARVARRLIAKHTAPHAWLRALERRDRYTKRFIASRDETAAGRAIYWDVVAKRCWAVASMHDTVQGVA